MNDKILGIHQNVYLGETVVHISCKKKEKWKRSSTIPPSVSLSCPNRRINKTIKRIINKSNIKKNLKKCIQR